jgi:hypothetical protein
MQLRSLYVNVMVHMHVVRGKTCVTVCVCVCVCVCVWKKGRGEERLRAVHIAHNLAVTVLASASMATMITRLET